MLLHVETGPRLEVLCYIFRQKLQSGKPTKPRVLGLVHHAHAAAAQLFKDSIVGDRLANHFSGSRLAYQMRMLGALAGPVNRTSAGRTFRRWDRPVFPRLHTVDKTVESQAAFG